MFENGYIVVCESRSLPVQCTEDGIVFNFSTGSVCVCLSVCHMIDNSSTVRYIIAKFSVHYLMVERAYDFENGYIGVRG